jgi:hypothetical protein
MEELKIPQTEWVREYLTRHFPGQSLPERAGGIATVIIDVTDSHGRPKELRISREFLQTFTKPTVEEYLQNARIAEQIETVPGSVSIVRPG